MHTWEDVLKFAEDNYDTIPAAKDTLLKFLREAMSRDICAPSKIEGPYLQYSYYGNPLPREEAEELMVEWSFSDDHETDRDKRRYEARFWIDLSGMFYNWSDLARISYERGLYRTSRDPEDEWYYQYPIDENGNDIPSTFPIDERYWAILKKMQKVEGVEQFLGNLYNPYEF